MTTEKPAGYAAMIENGPRDKWDRRSERAQLLPGVLELQIEYVHLLPPASRGFRNRAQLVAQNPF
ncbi:MAG: hypothetical protein WBM58_11400 [Sedimenticolaceae bacterium]